MIRNAIASLLVAGSQMQKPDPVAELLLASSPVTHQDGSTTWNPPSRYDHPFKGKTTIKQMPQKDVVEACRKLFADAGLKIDVSASQKGCAVYKGRNGVIIAIDKPFMGVTPDAVIRHERGHLNGWKQDHPD